MVGLRAASNMTATPPSLSKTNAMWSRGACAPSRCGANCILYRLFDRDSGYGGTAAVLVN
eukprot:3557456-Pyramimonas_sp.AAC.1